MTDRKVSVVIPVYNAEKFIRRAVESALILPEVGEIIVVDDGYPDKALQICRELQAAHDKVKLFQHPDGKNQGPGATRNLGISKARFAFIAFLDADDFYLENRFTAWSEVVSSRPEVDGVYDAVGTTFYDDATLNIELKDGLTTIPSRPSGAALFELLLDPGHGHFHTNGITVKKSIIEKAGCFNTALWLHQDTDLWTKISYHGNIVPGETGKAVAIRGVHRNNRISSRNFESKGKLYRSLFEYFRQKNISKKAAWLIFRNYILFNKKPFGNRIMNNISNLLFAVITITRFSGIYAKTSLIMPEADPFFSIVIPTFNRGDLLARAINSVLIQKFRDFELLICDDASTDNTAAVVGQVPDKRLRYLRAEKNGGNAAARNLGIKNAHGYYVAFLDSDDQYHSDFLEKMFAMINANNKPGFLWCRVNRVNEAGEINAPAKVYPWHPDKSIEPYGYFLKSLYFGTDCGFTVRRDCFATVGVFDERLRVAVDTDFILRIVRHFNFAFTTDILVDTYEHPGSRVRKNTAEKARSYGIILEKHRQRIDANDGLKFTWYYKLMWLNYHAGNRQIARSYLKFFFKKASIKALGLGLLFELLPASAAIKIHKLISGTKLL